MIRNNNDMLEIILDNKENTISSYADDTKLIFTDPKTHSEKH